MNKKSSKYRGRQFINPLNKAVGRRTGKNVRAGKNIRVRDDGLENFDDYLSDSDMETTREVLRGIQEVSEGSQTSQEDCKENQASQMNTITASQSNISYNITSSQQSMSHLSQGGPGNMSTFGWLRNRNIGRRTGKDLKSNKNIRVDERGFENFDDYLSESDVSSSFLSVSSYPSATTSRSLTRRSIRNRLSGHNSHAADESRTDSPRLSNTSQTPVTEADNDTTSDINTHSHREDDKGTPNDRSRESINNSLSIKNSANESGESVIENDKNDNNQMEDTEKSGEGNITKVADDCIVVENDTEESQSLKEDKEGTNLDASMENHHESDVESEQKTDDNSDNEVEIVSVDSNVDTVDDVSQETEEDDATSANENDDSNSIHSENDQVEIDDDGDNDKDKTSIETDQVEIVDNDDQDPESVNESELEDDQSDKDNTKEKQTTDEEIENEEEVNAEDNTAEVDDADNSDDEEPDSSGETEEEINTQENNHEQSESSKVKTNKSNSDSKVEASEVDDTNKEDNVSVSSDGENNPINKTSKSCLDPAGNTSGSITKLDNQNNSAFSFNRTKKRLSYSALESSNETKQIRKSRIEQANTELHTDTSKEKQTEIHINKETAPTISSLEKTKLTKTQAKKSAKVKELVDAAENKSKSKNVYEASNDSDFMCLTTRSTFIAGNKNSVESDEDDISIVDDVRHKVIANKPKTKNVVKNKTKSKKEQKKSSTESDNSDKDVGKLRLKKVAKSEAKTNSRKTVDKSRRKTTHGINEVVGDKSRRKSKKEMQKDNQDHSELGEPSVVEQIYDINNTDEFEKDIDTTKDKYKNTNHGKTFADDVTDKTGNNKNRKRKASVPINLYTNGENENLHSSVTIDEPEVNDENNEETKTRKNANRKLSYTADCTANNSLSDSKNLEKNDKRKAIKRKSSPDAALCDTISASKDTTAKGQKVVQQNIDIDDNTSSQGEQSNVENVTKLISKKIKSNKKSKTADKSNRTVDNSLNADKAYAKKKQSQIDSHDSNEELESSVVTAIKSTKAKKKLKSTRKSGRSKVQQRVNTSIGSRKYSSSEEEREVGLDSLDVSAGSHGDKGTPTTHSRLSAPDQFGSGVSFRVSRRSELLENIGSGYVGNISVQMEPSAGLTPCISRPGRARKSHGRRVTICPEENQVCTLSDDQAPQGKRGSLTYSEIGTPLPSPSSTPIHAFETTHTATPHPGPSSKPQDRLIHPEPAPDGLRRSQRTRLKPVAWYKNEHIVFDNTQPLARRIVGIKPSNEVKYLQWEAEKRKRRMLMNQIRKATKTEREDKKPYRRLSVHVPLPEDLESVEDGHEISVLNPFTDTEDGIECVVKRDTFKAVGPHHGTPRKDDPYLITQIFDQPCLSAGELVIRPRAVKPEQLVNTNAVIFRIEHGKVLVKIHETTTLLETGDSFFVPLGNTYSITNLRADTARLFYTIHKDSPNTEPSFSFTPRNTATLK